MDTNEFAGEELFGVDPKKRESQRIICVRIVYYDQLRLS